MFIPLGTVQVARVLQDVSRRERWGLFAIFKRLRLSFEDEGKHDFAAFRHEDVVGAAGGLAVHAFDADAACGKGADQSWMYKSLPDTRAEYDYVRRCRVDLCKMIGVQIVEGSRWPHDWRYFGKNYQAVGKTYGIDLDPCFVIGRDSLVVLGGGGMELHDAIDTRIDVNFRQLEEKDGAL